MIPWRLFRPTFRKLESVLQHNDHIRRTYLWVNKDLDRFERIAIMFKVGNSLSRFIYDLQQYSTNTFLHYLIKEQYMLNRSLVYDYRKNQFVLESFAPFSPQIQTVRVTIKNCKVEFIDDPAIRKSLYFHELKDIDKHVKIDYPNNLPNYLRHVQKKVVELKLLDKKNPLGVPFQAPPLVLNIQINQKFEVVLVVRLGVITLKHVHGIHSIEEKYNEKGYLKRVKSYKYRLDGMDLPVVTQYCMFKIVKYLGFDYIGLENFHKLAYIGGHVECIEKMMSYFDIVSVHEEEEYYDDIMESSQQQSQEEHYYEESEDSLYLKENNKGNDRKRKSNKK